MLFESVTGLILIEVKTFGANSSDQILVPEIVVTVSHHMLAFAVLSPSVIFGKKIGSILYLKYLLWQVVAFQPYACIQL